MFNAEDTLRSLGFPEEKYPELSLEFGMSCAQMPDELECLREDVIHEMCLYCGLVPEFEQDLQQAASIIRRHDGLKAFLWHVVFTLIHWRTKYADWPYPEKILGEHLAETFYLFAAFAAIRCARERYLKRGYPAEVVRDTLSSIREQETVRKKNGRIRYSPLFLSWDRRYLTCELFRLGRFEYFIANVGLQPTVLENSAGKRIVVQNTRFLPDCTIGNLVDVRKSETEEKETSFPLADWKILLRSGDPVLSMHIPSGGGMTLEASKDSFLRAFRFFHEYFPDRFKPAIVCKSWIGNPQFLELLPESNVSKLMREAYLYPLPSSGEDGMAFIFGPDLIRQYGSDYARYPHDNSIRRAMLSVLENGGRLRLGGMIFFEDEMPHFGNRQKRD